jgi:hypothetical protein
VKDAQAILQNTITWTINLGNGGRNGKTLALKMGCHFENSRPL